MKLIVAFFAIL